MNAFEDFLRSESLTDRRSALAQMGRGKREGGWMSWWHALALLPDVHERSQLVTSFPLSLVPNPSWKILMGLLLDPEQEVCAAAINSLANFQIKSLGHFLKKAILLHASSQRVLYCCVRYSEESQDNLILDDVFKQLSPQHSDAFLSRCFWAALKQFKVDKTLLLVATAILEEAQSSLNLERKSVVSAVLYILFAGSSELIEETFYLASQSLNTETRWLIGQFKQDWIEQSHVSSSEKADYMMKSMMQNDPYIIGFGSWSHGQTIEVLDCVAERLHDKKFKKLLPAAIRLLLKFGSYSHKKNLSHCPILGFSSHKPEADFAWQQWCLCADASDPLFIEGMLTSLRGQKWFLENPHKSLSSIVRCDDIQLVQFQTRKSLAANSQNQWDTSIQLGLSLRGIVPFAPPFSVPNVKGPELSHSLWVFEWGPPEWLNTSKAVEDCLLSLMISMSQALIESDTLEFRSPENYVSRCVGSLTLVLSEAFANKCIIKQSFLDKINVTVLYVTHALDMIGFGFKKSEFSSRLSDAGLDDSDDVSESSHSIVQNPIKLIFSLISVLLTDAQVPLETEKFLQSSLRWSNHVEKRWVVRALCKIDSQDSIKAVLYFALNHVDSFFVLFTVKELLNSAQSRAHQALIRLVGKKNITDEIKFLILEDVPMIHPDAVLSALKSLQGNQLSEQLEAAVKEAIGRAMGLVQNSGEDVKFNKHDQDNSLDTDSRLRNYLKGYDYLSVEVKSALRTSEMIFVQSQSWVKEAVDLSPIVNMQFKAVELVMRESFEPYTDSLLRKGVLSKKLDSIGYGRPISEKMQHFEDYLAELPIINSIPYFSKFKLRKMLRAICTFRPGKRFTLDGPKAFALFFLVVSREQCPFGLANMLPLNFRSQNEMFEYVKLVHALQDSRNRAVHEGLTWEAQEEIADIRFGCFHVIEESIDIGVVLSKQQT